LITKSNVRYETATNERVKGPVGFLNTVTRGPNEEASGLRGKAQEKRADT